MLSCDRFPRINPLPPPDAFTFTLPPRQSRISCPLGVVLLPQVSLKPSQRSWPGRRDALLDSRDHDSSGDAGEPKRVVRVPRQKYIPVSKSHLLEAILTNMFDDRDDILHFTLVSSCLDAIIHAEHKTILERMRADYGVVSAISQDQPVHDQLMEEVATNESKYNVCGNAIGTFESGTKDGADQNEKWEPICKRPKESSEKHLRNCIIDRSSVSVATRFQRTFLQLLLDAQFEELSAKDLVLTSALNTDYLLTLPIYVDWKRASEANSIIFRRGYATERQTGLLLADKLDYLQSKLLRGIFSGLSKPLQKLGTMIMEGFEKHFTIRLPKDLFQTLKKWLLEIPDYQNSDIRSGLSSYNTLEEGSEYGRDLPMWLASQRAVTRYEGILSPSGPRGRLLIRLLAWTGLVPPMREAPFELENDNDSSEPHLRPIVLSRVSLNDVWGPASSKSCGSDLWKMLKTSISILFSQSTLEVVFLHLKPRINNESSMEQLCRFLEARSRIYLYGTQYTWETEAVSVCWFFTFGMMEEKGDNLESETLANNCNKGIDDLRGTRFRLLLLHKFAAAKAIGFGVTVAFYLGNFKLRREAAFEELVLLYTEKSDQVDADPKSQLGSLQLKIYERIPIPDLPVVFPHKKLSFRIIDTVRLDIATLLGLLAYIINYKFEDILSSPSAIFLDTIAASALVIFVSRVVLGYKQTSDRYQLLVNKTLYERTLASGFGSVHFLLDASEQQQYKEAILTYAVLVNAKTEQVNPQQIAEECERFMYRVLRKKVKMPVEKAMKMLIRLGLANEACVNGNTCIRVIPVAKACESLKDRWNSMLN